MHSIVHLASLPWTPRQAHMQTKNQKIPPKHRVYVHLFQKFAWTSSLLSCDVNQEPSRNCSEKNLFRWIFPFWVDYIGFFFLLWILTSYKCLSPGGPEIPNSLKYPDPPFPALFWYKRRRTPQRKGQTHKQRNSRKGKEKQGNWRKINQEKSREIWRAWTKPRKLVSKTFCRLLGLLGLGAPQDSLHTFVGFRAWSWEHQNCNRRSPWFSVANVPVACQTPAGMLAFPWKITQATQLLSIFHRVQKIARLLGVVRALVHHRARSQTLRFRKSCFLCPNAIRSRSKISVFPIAIQSPKEVSCTKTLTILGTLGCANLYSSIPPSTDWGATNGTFRTGSSSGLDPTKDWQTERTSEMQESCKRGVSMSLVLTSCWMLTFLGSIACLGASWQNSWELQHFQVHSAKNS